jgi:hypothetical protein
VVSCFASLTLLGVISCSLAVSFDGYRPNAGQRTNDGGTAPTGSFPPAVAPSGGDGSGPGSNGPSNPPPFVGPDSAPTCPSISPFDATGLRWQVPRVIPASCTDADVLALRAYLDTHPSPSLAGMKSAADAGCADCVVGSEDDATWAPILANTAGSFGRLNVGGCVALETGDSRCGEAYQHLFDCQTAACAACSMRSAFVTLDICRLAASTGSCKAYDDVVSLVCGVAGRSVAQNACAGAEFAFEGPIRAQCIQPPP